MAGAEGLFGSVVGPRSKMGKVIATDIAKVTSLQGSIGKNFAIPAFESVAGSSSVPALGKPFGILRKVVR